MKNRRKIALSLLLVFSLLCAACNTTETTKKKKKKTTKKTTAETRVDPDDPTMPTYNEVAPTYLAPGEQTWFEKQGLQFTECGDFKMNIHSYDSVIQIPGHIEIETNYDCQEGYKNIVATTKLALGQGTDFHYWTSSFDKYTGTSFEFQNGTNSLYDGCNIINEGDVKLKIAECDYSLHIKEHITMEKETTTIVYTITCPYAYDGTVLQYGYCTEIEQYRDHDFKNNVIWYADDFTDMHGYYDYFTLQGLPKEGM